MKLWLVRHAEVQAAAGLCYGSSDLLACAGATWRAARMLATRLPPGVVVHASPLQRCRTLAQALRTLRPDLAPGFDDRLREMDFGRWERMRWADIPRADFDAWLADFADARPGGGESVRELMARVAAAWDAHRARGTDAVWITHAGVMRAALLLERHVRLPARAEDWPADALPYGQVRIVDQPAAG